MLYTFARVVCRAVLYSLRRMRVYGRENVPPAGGLVVAANHISYWDPVVVGAALERRVYFLAKREVFAIPLLGPLITALGAFPVDRRHPGAGTIRRAVSIVAAGGVLVVFPEGGRNRTGRILPPELGAFLVAGTAKAAVLPVAIAGSRGVAGRVRVYIGEAMPPPAPGRAGLAACGRWWVEAVSSLLA